MTKASQIASQVSNIGFPCTLSGLGRQEIVGLATGEALVPSELENTAITKGKQTSNGEDTFFLLSSDR